MGCPANHRARLHAAAFAVLAGLATPAVAQSFTLVGGGLSYVFGLSADGRSAAGWISPDTGFLWTSGGGRNDFGLTASPTQGRGISGDGRYVVGGAGPSGGVHAFRWSEAGGYQNLGTLAPYPNSNATDASYDGSIVVGTLDAGSGLNQAFRWTQATGMQGLGAGTTAFGVSGDGNVIVGEQGTAPRGFVWTQAGGMQFLDGLGGAGSPSLARAINFDGSIVVGRSGTFSAVTTMWTNGVPIALLNTIPNSVFTATGVSDNGSAASGQFQASPGGLIAGVWTQGTGCVRLADYLTANGVTLPPGIVLEDCTAISADGRTFAGYTANGPYGIQGFVATLHRNCVADLDDDGNVSNGGTRDHAVTIDDLLYFLAAFESGNLAADLDNGTGTGTKDHAVTIDDLLFFLGHFEAGC